MYNQIKSLGKQSIVYGIGGILNQFVSVLLVPVYTRYLSPEEYGIVQLLLVTSAFVIIVAQLGLASAIFKSALYDKTKDTRVIYSTAFIVLAVSAVLLLAFGSVTAGFVSNLLFDTAQYTRLAWIMFATAALDTISVLTFARLRIEGRALQFSIVNFAAFFFRLLLNILFIVALHRGAAGLMEANALQSLVFALIYIWLVRDQLSLQFSTDEFLNLISFGIPLVPALISSRVLSMSDRYILKSFVDLEEVGLYSLGYRIASVVSLAASAFQTAWPAVLFSAGKSKDAPRFYARVMTYLLLFSGFLALGLSVLSEDILKILSAEAFHPAYRVVPWLALSYVFYGAYFVTTTGIQLQKKNFHLAYIVAVAALLQIGLNFLLIPRMGMMGAALNTALSYLIMPFLVILVSHRFYPVPYEYRRIGKMALAALIIYYLGRLVRIENSLISFTVRGLIVASFPFALGVLGFYTADEKRRVQQLAKQAWRRSRSFVKREALTGLGDAQTKEEL